MTVELDEEEARLLYAVVIEKAQEHFSYANTSEVADRLCKLATRFERPTATPKRLPSAKNAEKSFVARDCNKAASSVT